MTQFIKRLRAFRKSESGSTTVEFAIIFPFFMMLLTSAVELGVINLRQVALDNRVESAMRIVRINTSVQFTANDIRDMICEDAPMLGDCENNLRIQLEPGDPRNYSPLSDYSCLHRDGDNGMVHNSGVPNFNLGNANQIVLVRACLIFNPILPTSYLSAQRIADSEGADNNLAAISTLSAFTQEPR